MAEQSIAAEAREPPGDGKKARAGNEQRPAGHSGSATLERFGPEEELTGLRAAQRLRTGGDPCRHSEPDQEACARSDENKQDQGMQPGRQIVVRREGRLAHRQCRVGVGGRSCVPKRCPDSTSAMSRHVERDRLDTPCRAACCRTSRFRPPEWSTLCAPCRLVCRGDGVQEPRQTKAAVRVQRCGVRLAFSAHLPSESARPAISVMFVPIGPTRAASTGAFIDRAPGRMDRPGQEFAHA